MADDDFVTIELQISRERFEMFESCQQALDHDEPEQTFALMLNLLVQAIGLTSKENRTVYLYTRNAHKTSFTHVICPTCQKEVPVVNQVSDGFREGSVQLI
jgi:hypothetical protein